MAKRVRSSSAVVSRVSGEPPRMRTISLTIETDLLAQLDAIAAAESRSRAKQISVALRQFADAWRETRVVEPRRRRVG
jgi:metal-responsive CopG/Arc/MetJ family transcriptional regulator